MIVRRLRNVLLIALGAGLLWAVAPALSTEPYVPQAKDFEQRLPRAIELGEREPLRARAGAEPRRAAKRQRRHLDAHGPVRYRTPPIRAPYRFDLVGVAGERHELEFRTRTDGEAWTDWVEASNGDPVWAGGADEVQVRSRDVPIEGKLHYVNVSGSETSASRLLNGLRSAVNSAVIAVAANPLTAGTAEAKSPRPKFVSRKQWGANRKRGGCKPRDRPSIGKVKGGAIHHTDGTNSYSRAQAPSVILGICRYHRNANRWDDIGYNALVDRFGTLYQGRAGGMRRAIIGAHAEGVNTWTTGIAVVGDFQKQRIRRKTKRSIVHYLAWKLDVANRRPAGKIRLRSTGGASSRAERGQIIVTRPIFGHRDTNFTACPGNRLYRQIRKIRKAVQRRMVRFRDEKKDDKGDEGDDTGGDGGGSRPRGGIRPT